MHSLSLEELEEDLGRRRNLLCDRETFLLTLEDARVIKD
jgi:hypothetical protein